jgi:uncharacterized protein (TIGR02118 family)
MKLTVLYPQPLNQEKFESDYNEHLKLLHDKTGIPSSEKPYSVTRFISGPEGKSPFHLMFIMPFESQELLEKTMSSPGMQEVAADATRISTGGVPTILIGQTI